MKKLSENELEKVTGGLFPEGSAPLAKVGQKYTGDNPDRYYLISEDYGWKNEMQGHSYFVKSVRKDGTGEILPLCFTDNDIQYWTPYEG